MKLSETAHCRIGKVTLKGGASLTLLQPAKPIGYYRHINPGGEVIIKSADAALTLERALFLLEDAAKEIYNDAPSS